MSIGRRLIVSVLAVLAAICTLTSVDIPGASGALHAAVANSADTAASNAYFTCSSAAVGETGTKAYFAYPFAETSGLSAAADASGNNRTGNYGATGVTYRQAGPCPRDAAVAITLDGNTGYVSGPNSTQTNPTVFSEEIWFKTTAAQGKLIGFGSSRTGSSASYDRHLYIDTAGKLEFGVYPTVVKTIASTTVVTDGQWHYAVGTLSAAGMVLYLDGVQVAKDATVTTAQNYAGYWRIGYDNLSSWTNSPTSAYFKGSLAYAAAYTYALTAAQVAAHYAAGS